MPIALNDPSAFAKRRLLGVAICFGGLILTSASCFAVNRCTDLKGKVTFQDTACETAAAERSVDISEAFSTKPGVPLRPSSAGRPATAAAPVPEERQRSGEYASARGTWRGPAQFQVSVGGVRDATAHAVTPMVIELRATGEVAGVIPAKGCAISGLATEFVAPYVATVDVSLKSCEDRRFNARFSGHLHANAAAREAKLTLHAISMPLFAGKVQQTSLEAVLKR